MAGELAIQRHNRLILVVTIVLVVAAFAAGRVSSDEVLTGDKPVRLLGFFSGTVSQVDASGSAICVIPDGREATDQRCSIPMLRPGTPKLQTGQHVGVAVESVQLTKEHAIEVFVVYAPAPQP